DVTDCGKTVLDEASERHVDVALGGAPEQTDRAPDLSFEVVAGALSPAEDPEHRGMVRRDQLLLSNVRHGLVRSILVTPEILLAEPQNELRVVGHLLRRPRRVPRQLDLDVL